MARQAFFFATLCPLSTTKRPTADIKLEISILTSQYAEI